MSNELPNTEITSSPNLIPVFVVIVIFMFVVGLISYANSDSFSSESNQHSQSYGLLGHHALRSILEKLQFEVNTNRSMTMQPGANSSVLFIVPSAKKIKKFSKISLKQNIKNILQSSANVVVVCPKWQEVTEKQKGKLVTIEKKITTLKKVRHFVRNLHNRVKLFRSNFSNFDVTYKERSFSLQTSGHIQLFENNNHFVPIVHSPYGNLVIKLPSKKGNFFLVSDPDIFTNQEIGKEDNGFLIINLLNKITNTKKIWLDEVGHGFGRHPSIIRILLRFPVVCITIQLLFFFVFLIARLWNPFHQITPEVFRERSRKEQVRSISYLSYSSKKHNFFLKKYFDCTIQQMENKYPSIKNMDLQQKLDYLDYIGQNKGTTHTIKNIHKKIQLAKTPQKIKHILYYIEKWKEKVCHGKH